MDGAIDFHAHILPGADHGSNSVETSLTQLSAAEKAGVSLIAATPHFYPFSSSSNDFFSRCSHCWETLKQAYAGPIKIILGAEVYLCEGLQNHPRLEELCIEGTNIMLVEMPSAPWGPRLEETLDELDASGIYILLAHIERYPSKDVDRLLSRGFHAQINAESLSKLRTRNRDVGLIDAGFITALGSDVHGPDKSYGAYERGMQLLKERAEVLQSRMRGLLDGPNG